MAKSFLNTNLTRGLRNNNPGNIRRANINWLGKIPFSQSTDAEFEQFKELRYGLRALMRNLVSYHKNGFKTAGEIITRWAPHFENDTAAYIAAVVKLVGVSTANAVLELTQETVVGLAKAIVRVELGKTDAAKITDADYWEAMALNADLKLKKKVTPSK